MAKTPDSAEMARRGRMGALSTASRYSGLAITAKARATFINSFIERARAEALERGEVISDEEAIRRGELLRRLHYTRIRRLRGRSAA